MLLAGLVETSQTVVAATRSRKAKVAAIAERLARGRRSTSCPVVTAYLGGTLLQRRTGRRLARHRLAARAGRRADADRRSRCTRPSTASPALSGAGSQAARAAGGARPVRPRHRRRAALAARRDHRQRPPGRARRAGPGGDRGRVGRAADRRTPRGDARGRHRADRRSRRSTGGEAALAEIGLEVGRPVLPMLASSAPDVAAAMAKAGGGAGGGRHQARRHPDPGAPPRRRRRWSPPAASTTSPTGCPRWSTVARVAAGRASSSSTARRSRSTTTAGRGRSRRPRRARPMDARASRVTPYFFDVLHVDGRDLLDRPGTERLGRARRARARASTASPRLVTDDPDAADAFAQRRARPRPRGRRREGLSTAVRRRPSRLRLGQGQAGAHPRPGRARGRVGQRPARGLAVQHPPRRPRPRRRRLRDARQDLQGDDRRDARLADRAVHRARASSPTTIRDHYVVPLRPEQVVEIAFDGLQRSTRYPGGLALRFARVVRYRDDKARRRGRHDQTVRSYVSTA